MFFKKLKQPIQKSDSGAKIEKKPLLIIGIILLSVCTVLLAVSSYINMQMWVIAALFAALLFISVLTYSLIKRTRPDELIKTLTRVPYELIPFVISMFVMVLTLDKYDVTDSIVELLGNSNLEFVYGAASVLVANLINNIPMSVLFSVALQGLDLNYAIYAVIIGSNIGALFTPIAALAGIMWIRILKENGVELSFIGFVKYGTLIGIPTLSAALFALVLM